MVAEKVELLGTYPDIPKELTLTSLPTSSELDYVGAEDFREVMLDKILPQCIQEKINCRNLLELDFLWICRALRLLNYGPYHTTNMIICPECRRIDGSYQVDLRAVDCMPLPENFTNVIEIPGTDFLDFKDKITFKLLTIQEVINVTKDKMFVKPNGDINVEFARICYMITSIGQDKNLTPIQVKSRIDKDMSPADYIILKERIRELSNYGLRAGGFTRCPVCGNPKASFMALVDDRFFRPTLGNLHSWRDDRSARRAEDVSGSETAAV